MTDSKLLLIKIKKNIYKIIMNIWYHYDPRGLKVLSIVFAFDKFHFNNENCEHNRQVHIMFFFNTK